MNRLYTAIAFAAGLAGGCEDETRRLIEEEARLPPCNITGFYALRDEVHAAVTNALMSQADGRPSDCEGIRAGTDALDAIVQDCRIVNDRVMVHVVRAINSAEEEKFAVCGDDRRSR